MAALLAERGAVVIDADRAAHEIYARDTEGYSLVVERFGERVVGADGAIDRALLGQIVFNDRAALEDLNGIVHPLVRKEVAQRIADAIAEDEDAVIVVEAALMAETGWSGGAGEVWVTVTDSDVVVDRLVNLRGMEPEEVLLRMAAQTDNETRRRHATRVIENNGTVEDLEAEVDGAWRELVGSE